MSPPHPSRLSIAPNANVEADTESSHSLAGIRDVLWVRHLLPRMASDLVHLCLMTMAEVRGHHPTIDSHAVVHTGHDNTREMPVTEAGKGGIGKEMTTNASVTMIIRPQASGQDLCRPALRKARSLHLMAGRVDQVLRLYRQGLPQWLAALR